MKSLTFNPAYNTPLNCQQQVESEIEMAVSTSLAEEFKVLLSDPANFYETVMQNSGEYRHRFVLAYAAWIRSAVDLFMYVHTKLLDAADLSV